MERVPGEQMIQKYTEKRGSYLTRLSILSQLSQIITETINEQIIKTNLKQQKTGQNFYHQNTDLSNIEKNCVKSQSIERINQQSQRINKEEEQVKFCLEFIKRFYLNRDQNWKILFQNQQMLFKNTQSYQFRRILTNCDFFSKLSEIHNSYCQQLIDPQKQEAKQNIKTNKKNISQEQLTIIKYSLQNVSYGQTQLETTYIQFGQNHILLNPTTKFKNRGHSVFIKIKNVNCIYLTSSSLNCFIGTIYILLYLNFPIQILTTKSIYSQYLKFVAFLAIKHTSPQNQIKQLQQLHQLYQNLFNVCLIQPKQYFKFHAFTALLQPNLFPFQCYDMQIFQKGKKILVIQTQNIQNLKAIYLKHKAGQISQQMYLKYVQELQRRESYQTQRIKNQNHKNTQQKLLMLTSKQSYQKNQNVQDGYKYIKYCINKTFQKKGERIIILSKDAQNNQKDFSQSRVSQIKKDKFLSLKFDVDNNGFNNSSTLQLKSAQKNNAFKIIKGCPDFFLLSDQNIKDILQNSLKVELTKGQIIQHANKQIQHVFIKLEGQFRLTKSRIINNQQFQEKHLQNIKVFGWNYFLNQNRKMNCAYLKWIPQNEYNFQCNSEYGMVIKIQISVLQFIISSKIQMIVHQILEQKNFPKFINQLDFEDQLKEYIMHIYKILTEFFIKSQSSTKTNQSLCNQFQQIVQQKITFTLLCLYRAILYSIFNAETLVFIQKQAIRTLQSSSKNAGVFSIKIILKQKVLEILKKFYFNFVFFDL